MGTVIPATAVLIAAVLIEMCCKINSHYQPYDTVDSGCFGTSGQTLTGGLPLRDVLDKFGKNTTKSILDGNPGSEIGEIKVERTVTR